VSESTSVDTGTERWPEREAERTEELSALRPALPVGRAPDINAPRLRDRLVTRPGLIAVGVVLAIGLLYCYLCWLVSSTVPANSDAASISLQGWDLTHGNPLLRNWITRRRCTRWSSGSSDCARPPCTWSPH
jgi:hypothetical protein